MAFDTYTGLVAELPGYTLRTDQTAAIPGFIALAEAAMNRGIRSRRKITRATATISDEFSAVPDDFGGMRSIRLSGGTGRALGYLSPEAMADLNTGPPTEGTLTSYSIVGDEFQYGPWPATEADVEITYYQKIPALSDDNASNWVLADHPDCYLYGALYYAALHVRNAEKAALYLPLFRDTIDTINRASLDEDMGGALQAMPSTYGAGYI
jgi:hypothetical protein